MDPRAVTPPRSTKPGRIDCLSVFRSSNASPRACSETSAWSDCASHFFCVRDTSRVG